MIINDYVNIETKGSRKLKYFESLGYDIDSDFIKLKITDLSNGSRQLVDVSCDFCGKIVNITYREYVRNISMGGKYACCKKCGSLKAKENNNLKYGVDHPMKLENIQKKVKDTNLQKYGVEYLQQSKLIKEKSKQKILNKYGVDHISKSEKIRLKTSKISLDDNYIKYLKDNISLFRCDCGKKHEFEINNDNYFHRKRDNLPLCTICYPINKNKSLKEEQLYKYLKSIYDKEIIQSYRDGLEIDIYLPDLKLGFEFNGLYWHSEEWKDKNYHFEKTNHFLERGIRIIHIWEDDWVYKRKILESQIVNWIGLVKNRIFARKCVVKEINNSKIVTKFLNENHIQGKVNSSLKLGLYHNNELVSLMTFDNFEGRKKMEEGEWNINRFCSKLNTNVIGGGSKLFKYFINNYMVNRVISYSDRDWSLGNLYDKLGFKKVNENNPDYKYLVDGIRIHKSRYRKSFTNIPESKIDILKVWDCGKIKYEKKLDK